MKFRSGLTGIATWSLLLLALAIETARWPATVYDRAVTPPPNRAFHGGRIRLAVTLTTITGVQTQLALRFENQRAEGCSNIKLPLPF